MKIILLVECRISLDLSNYQIQKFRYCTLNGFGYGLVFFSPTFTVWFRHMERCPVTQMTSYGVKVNICLRCWLYVLFIVVQSFASIHWIPCTGIYYTFVDNLMWYKEINSQTRSASLRAQIYSNKFARYKRN